MLIDVGRTRDAARLLRAAHEARRHDAVPVPLRSPCGRRRPCARGRRWARPAGRKGPSLSLGDAVELAQRMRGERVRALPGWESLTPTEVAGDRAGGWPGLTNPQIADRLLMSRATVKTHLVHVYAKLRHREPRRARPQRPHGGLRSDRASVAPPMTFLFTDIEGSTRRWEEIARHERPVERHFEVLGKPSAAPWRRACSRRWATASRPPSRRPARPWQRRSTRSGPMPRIGVVVRMGLHTGEVERVGDDFRGRPVNRAARIMAVGHGGPDPAVGGDRVTRA